LSAFAANQHANVERAAHAALEDLYCRIDAVARSHAAQGSLGRFHPLIDKRALSAVGKLPVDRRGLHPAGHVRRIGDQIALFRSGFRRSVDNDGPWMCIYRLTSTTGRTWAVRNTFQLVAALVVMCRHPRNERIVLRIGLPLFREWVRAQNPIEKLNALTMLRESIKSGGAFLQNSTRCRFR
jgi:hypothetical protein